MSVLIVICNESETDIRHYINIYSEYKIIDYVTIVLKCRILINKLLSRF